MTSKSDPPSRRPIIRLGGRLLRESKRCDAQVADDSLDLRTRLVAAYKRRRLHHALRVVANLHDPSLRLILTPNGEIREEVTRRINREFTRLETQCDDESLDVRSKLVAATKKERLRVGTRHLIAHSNYIKANGYPSEPRRAARHQGARSRTPAPTRARTRGSRRTLSGSRSSARSGSSGDDPGPSDPDSDPPSSSGRQPKPRPCKNPACGRAVEGKKKYCCEPCEKQHLDRLLVAWQPTGPRRFCKAGCGTDISSKRRQAEACDAYVCQKRVTDLNGKWRERAAITLDDLHVRLQVLAIEEQPGPQWPRTFAGWEREMRGDEEVTNNDRLSKPWRTRLSEPKPNPNRESLPIKRRGQLASAQAEERRQRELREQLRSLPANAPPRWIFARAEAEVISLPLPDRVAA